MNAEEFMSAMQVAKHLGISDRAVRYRAARGQLPRIETPIGSLYRRADVEVAEPRNGHPARRKSAQKTKE